MDTVFKYVQTIPMLHDILTAAYHVCTKRALCVPGTGRTQFPAVGQVKQLYSYGSSTYIYGGSQSATPRCMRYVNFLPSVTKYYRL